MFHNATRIDRFADEAIRTKATGEIMVKYPQMKLTAFILLAFVSACDLAGARVIMSSLPEAECPLAEVETNVVFSTGTATDNKWTLTIECDAAVSNCVEVVLGRDADAYGVLGIDECCLSICWDCGEWFWRDRRGVARWGQRALPFPHNGEDECKV